MARNKLRYLIISAFLIFILTAGIVIKRTNDIIREDYRIAIATKVFETLDKLRLKLRSTIIFQNHYLITNDESFLKEYNKTKEEVFDYYEKLKQLDYKHFINKGQMDSLGLLLNEKMQFLDTLLVMNEAGDTNYIPYLIENKGYPLFKEIRVIAEENSKELEQIISEFRMKTDRDAKYITLTIVLGYLAGLLLLIFIFAYLIAEIKRRMLSEKQISRQAKELIQNNRTKDMFFSIIAHDLKGPFNSLLNLFALLNIAIEDKDVEKLKKYTQGVEFSARRTYNLLQNLLEWAKLQTGKMKSMPEYFNLDGVIKINIDLFNEAANQKNISFIYTSGDNIIYADKNMTETVIRNLIGNAIKFTENGSITIKVHKKNQHCIVSITDTGIGIEEEDIPKLFRIEIDTSSIGNSKEKGSGLGLILCKNFVELNGGEIWVESELGKGTSFFFTLPSSV